MIEYAKFPNGTMISHTGFFTEGGIVKVEILFEQKAKSARYTLPEHKWIYIDGFNKNEIARFEKIAEQMGKDLIKVWFNATQIWTPPVTEWEPNGD